jgi:eukaryotic-like serine/threonine-protein kinase
MLARGASVGGVIAGKYRIERVIGHGGMGVVVAARHLQLERTVAIKLIRGDWADDPLAVERLVREAKALASIQSEHVARVLDVGTLADGIPFIVMEYLEGRDLATLLERDGPLPSSDAVDFILQACEALAEAHRNGIVHRDIKPANLFVARQPGGVASIKVVDFGISKLINSASVESLTHPSRIVGSLYHMAPEQMRGEAVDARTDVWAIGVLLFELITGRKPFQDAAWPAVCARVLNESAPPLGSLGDHVPEELGAAVRRCLNRTPEDRFANVAELAVALSPFGSRSARVSLERIVRLATSTGSLSAESLSPLPPGARASAPPARVVHDTTIDPAQERQDANRPSSVGSGTAPSPRVVEPGPPQRGRAAASGARAAGSVGGNPVANDPAASDPVRSRRERWGAALAGAALLIGLPWLWARNAAQGPGEPSTEVASAALRPSEPERPTLEIPGSAPAVPAPSVTDVPEPNVVATPSVGAAEPGAVVSEPRGVPPEAAAARALDTPRAPAPNAPAAGASAVGTPALDTPAADAPAVSTPRASPAASTAEATAPAEAVRTAAPAPSLEAVPPSAPAVAAAPAASPPSAPAATPPSAPPATAGQQRGANPWDLRDLEFE